MKRIQFFFLLGGLLLQPLLLQAQATTTAPAPASAPATGVAPATQPSAALPEKMLKEKSYSLYKVQIFVKEDPNGPKSTRAVILDAKGLKLAEIRDFDVEPDPRETVEGWSGGNLDLDADGAEDLFLRTFSGGAHCCYGIKAYSLGKGFKKLADLKLLDCGEKVRLKDLNGDGPLEIIACNAAFTYLRGLPFSSSPFPPLIFGIEGAHYANQDKKYPQVFDEDVAAEKKKIDDKTATEGDILQIVLNYFLSGREPEGWKQFETLYNFASKEKLRTELNDRWRKYQGLPPESKPAETKPAEPPRAGAPRS